MHTRPTLLASRLLAVFLIFAFLLPSGIPAGAAARAAGVTAPSQPADPIPSALLDPDSVSWASVRGMTGSQFSTYFDEKARAGFMVLDIEVDEVDGVERVGAVWQKNLDNRGWFELRNMSASEYTTELAAKRTAGYRLIDQEVYELDGRTQYAAVWIFNTENLEWVSYTDQTDEEFGVLFDRYNGVGYLMIDIDAGVIDGALTYSAVWVDNSENLLWHEWRDLTSDEFAAKFDEYKDAYRMIDVESYQVGLVQLYAGIWVENINQRLWQEWRDMTSKEFGDKWLRLRDEGYRLIDYETYPTLGGWRYAGIWRQNSERPYWALKDQVDILGLVEWVLYGIPGMSVAISQNGTWMYLRGFGYADVGDEVIAHSRTIFRLASVSKAVGGVLAMRLQEQGLVDLSDPTRDLLPAMPDFHTHTISETLSNRAGIGAYETYPLIAGSFDTALAPAMLMWNVPLLATPGSTYIYSTHAYTFAGASLEAAVGDPIGTIFEDQLHTPFTLGTLQIEDRSVPNKYRSSLYNTDNDEVDADDLSWKVLGGGMESSAYDLVRFGNRVYNGSILNATSLDLLWTPPDGLSNYALGWNTGVHLGAQVVAKDGLQNGARSYLRIYPDNGIVIAILTNRKEGGHDPGELAKAIGALMIEAGAIQHGPQQTQADEIEEPDEEGLDPAQVVWPVDDPVATPSPQDLEEPPGEMYISEVIFLPLMTTP